MRTFAKAFFFFCVVILMFCGAGIGMIGVPFNISNGDYGYAILCAFLFPFSMAAGVTTLDRLDV